LDTVLLRRLLDIGRRMAETHALDPLLTYAVDISLEILNAQYGYLVLTQKDGTLDFRVRRDNNGNNIPRPESQISHTIFYRVLESGEPTRTASAVEDPNFRDAVSVAHLQLRSVLCVPLISHGRTLGALYVESRVKNNLFTEEDLEPLQYLAAHAAVCIDNALLVEELEDRVAHHTRDLEIANAQLRDKLNTQEIEAIQAVLEHERMDILYNFIQDASHQFRTPLSIINVSIDILARKIDMSSYGTYIERIHSQVNTIVGLVDSLILMAKLDSEFVIDEQAINLNEVAYKLWDAFEQRALNKDQLLNIQQTESPLYIHGMLDYIQQAIGSILINAIQYTGKQGKITISVTEDDDSAIVTIRDTGVGIDEEELAHVFTRFYRSDKAGTTRGLGLGLSITQKIMELHQGRIEVHSKVGQGSIFSLFFPKMKGDL
jgi:signal transduction histidine kinase